MIRKLLLAVVVAILGIGLVGCHESSKTTVIHHKPRLHTHKRPVAPRARAHPQVTKPNPAVRNNRRPEVNREEAARRGEMRERTGQGRRKGELRKNMEMRKFNK